MKYIILLLLFSCTQWELIRTENVIGGKARVGFSTHDISKATLKYYLNENKTKEKCLIQYLVIVGWDEEQVFCDYFRSMGYLKGTKKP